MKFPAHQQRIGERNAAESHPMGRPRAGLASVSRCAWRPGRSGPGLARIFSPRPVGGLGTSDPQAVACETYVMATVARYALAKLPPDVRLDPGLLVYPLTPKQPVQAADQRISAAHSASASMHVHVDVSLCRVIVTQIVTQLVDHPLGMDQLEIFGRLAQLVIARRAPCSSFVAAVDHPDAPHRIASRHAPQPPIALAVRSRSSVSAACSSCACCVPVACLSLPTDDARYLVTVVSRRPEP